MRDARDQFARMIGSSALEVIFTSGGSEANNLALKGVFESLEKDQSPRRQYLVSAVEHPSIMKTTEYLRGRGAIVQTIPVSRAGAIDLEAYERLLDEKTALVSVMLANNETGNIYPVAKMAELAHAKGALFHSDCVQALGKIPVNVRELGVDMATFSGHKFYALKGVGVLYARKGMRLESLIHGGGQERHRRGGTENTVAIASLGTMSEHAAEVEMRGEEVRRLRDLLESRILAEIPGVIVTGSESPRLPNVSSLVIEGVDGEIMLMNLDLRGYSVSTGAACSSGNPEPSPVLLAMGLSRAEAQSSLRLGLGWGNTEAEIESFIADLAAVVEHIRSLGSTNQEKNVGLR